MHKNENKLISVCIPTYEMYGHGHIFLEHSLQILSKQTFKKFNVIISDYSKDNLIENVCKKYTNILDIKYIKNNNPVIGMSLNINNSIFNADGDLIKILFLDDFLYDDKSLEKIANNFNLKKDKWMVTACIHSNDGKTFENIHYPQNNKNIHLGKNTIGSPSVLTIRKDCLIDFDTNLKWFVDCDYYKRCYEKYGNPKILNDITVVIRTGEHQITNTEVNNELKIKESNYLREKYNIKNKRLNLNNVTLVAVSGINPKNAVKALEISMENIDYHEILLISHYSPENLDKRITFKKCKDTELMNRDPKNTNDYSKFIAYDLYKYINSDYVLIVHNDAYVLRPHKWDNRFYDYDYIGAPWPPNIHYTNEGENIRVGNGGFSFRSKKMLNALNELKLPFTDNGTGYYNEDGIICVYYRKKLEEYGIKYAPVSIASIFSHELDCNDSESKPFGFHNNKKVIPFLFLLVFNINKFRKNKKMMIKNYIKKIKIIVWPIVKTLRAIKKKKRETFNKKSISRLFPNGIKTMIEIGTANGDDTLDFLKLFNSKDFKIFGFEPEPKNIEIIKNNIEDPRFKLFEGVVSDIDGKLTFNRSRNDDPNGLSLSGSIMKPKNHLKLWSSIYFDQTIDVKSITLDTFVKENNIDEIDFIWCDVQGAEEKVILGGKETFKNKVKYLYTEYSNDEQYENQPNKNKILKLLPDFEIVKDFGTDILLRNKNMISNRFEKYPKLTLITSILIVFIILDLIIGSMFLPKGIRSDNRVESPYFNHTLNANYNGKDSWTAGEYPLITNSLGFKDRIVRNINSTTTKERIIFIGDSFTEGIGIPYEETFVGLIDKELDSKKYEVLNAGVVSYSPYIYYLKTKYLIEHGLKFNELVVFNDISDVQDEITYQDWKPSNPNQIQLIWNSIIKNTDFFLEHHSLIYLHGIRPIIFGVQTKRIKKIFLGAKSDTDKITEKDKEYLNNRGRWTFDDKVYEEWGKKGLDLEIKHMNELYELCKKNNIKLSIAVYPWPDQIINNDLYSRQVTVWEKFAKNHKIDFYNLFPIFIDNGLEKSKTVENYFLPHNDVHWNSFGHRIVANEWLRQYIINNNK